MPVHVQNVAGAGYFSGSSHKGYLQPALPLGHSTALKKDGQAMLVLRHERGLPPAPASLIQKVGQRVFVFTRVACKLDYNGLVFFHMRVVVTQARCMTVQHYRFKNDRTDT
jgi:hypothetical protein